jgi:restriction system protein
VFRSFAAAVLLVLASTAMGAGQAEEYWRCRSATGVTAIQDRPCAASEQTISAPTSAVRLIPQAAVRPPGAQATPVSNALQPLIALAWKVAIASIALLVIAMAGRILLVGGQRKKGASGERAGGKTKRAALAPHAASLPRDLGQPPGQSPEAAGSRVETPAQWSVDLLKALEWKRVEEVCEGFWKAKGYPARVTGPGTDGGVDVIIADHRDPTKVFAVAQCKAWSKPVGVEPVRALWGVRDHFGAQLAIFYSVAGFSSDARAFADGKHLKLVSGDELLAQLLTLPQIERTALLQHVTRGDYSTPSCPKCEVKMIRKQGQPGRSDYWACPNFRACRTRPMPVRTGT